MSDTRTIIEVGLSKTSPAMVLNEKTKIGAITEESLLTIVAPTISLTPGSKPHLASLV
jgi:hypothetical protein